MENFTLLLGKSPGKKFLEDIEKSALSVRGVLAVHDVKAEYFDEDTVKAYMHIVISRKTSLESAHRIIKRVSEKIKKSCKCKNCLIHVDPSYSRNLKK